MTPLEIIIPGEPRAIKMMVNAFNKHSQNTLLIVDDEPIIRELCASALHTYQIQLAENGLEALRILENEDIDIVLSDVVMPELGGLELLSRIKEHRPDMAVILMTGYSDKDLILEALKTGADDFINKPINILQLSTTVDKVLEKQKIREELAALKRTEKLKSDFLGLISHKLKTPATAISLFIQNISDGVESPSDEDFKQMLAMVQAETVHLEQLIQDLLYFSEATLHDEELPLEPVDLGKIADQVALALKPAAVAQGIEYLVDLDNFEKIRLPLNPQRITFAIRALLDNAIKFTAAGGTVSMHGEALAGKAKIMIKDSGIGIAQKELSKIFNKFYQIDPEQTGQVRGFGLGLFYARSFIRSMNGQLYIESHPDQGTAATIEFPLSS